VRTKDCTFSPLERMVKEQNLKDKVREKLDENTPFKHSQCKRVEIEEKGKKKYVTKILETTLAKQKFISILIYHDRMQRDRCLIEICTLDLL
jgi:hypothetical protein